MFKQNSKKQTVLSFGQKPKATSAKPTRTETSATASASAKPLRAAPYTLPSQQRPTTSASALAIPGPTQSRYFRPLPVHQYDARQQQFEAQQQKTKRSNASFGSQISSMAYNKPPIVAGHSVQPYNRVSLSARQREAFDIAVNRRESLFITGSAGTGKSVLLREIIRAFTESLGLSPNEVQTTASTGIAAFHIRGKTIHSFSGVGLAKGSKEDILRFVNKSHFAKTRWTAVKVLIIDEISMLDASLFDALEFVARKVRRSEQFFGGIQVILTGDFYQLPPVEKSGVAKFAFEAEVWKKVESTVVLTHVFRQKDMRFVDILNEMRLGRLSEAGVDIFKGLSRVPKYPDDGIMATELYALRNQVDGANRKRLQSLPGSMQVFSAHDGMDPKQKDQRPVPEEVRVRIDGWSMAPRKLELKQFAQVMLIKNMPDSSLVNGSRGVVTKFLVIGNKEYPVVRFTNGAELTLTPESSEVDLGREKYVRTQLPIILAWALSIHKSQGQTIDRVLVDLGKVFEKGQAYVALSRAVSLDALQVLNFNPQCVMAHPKVIEYYAELSRKQ